MKWYNICEERQQKNDKVYIFRERKITKLLTKFFLMFIYPFLKQLLLD